MRSHFLRFRDFNVWSHPAQFIPGPGVLDGIPSIPTSFAHQPSPPACREVWSPPYPRTTSTRHHPAAFRSRLCSSTSSAVVQPCFSLPCSLPKIVVIYQAKNAAAIETAAPFIYFLPLLLPLLAISARAATASSRSGAKLGSPVVANRASRACWMQARCSDSRPA